MVDRHEEKQPVTVRLPISIIDALNSAAVSEERASTSDMIRIALEHWLNQNGYMKSRVARRRKPKVS